MKRLIWITLAALPSLFAQLTAEQKAFDFQSLVATYNRFYAPYEWKREQFGFDMLDLKPWLDRVRNSKDDLEFYEICSEYVASLRDTHTSMRIPSVFSATTGLHVDIYDGKVIIDGISRAALPASQFPFQVGDEVVSVDGKPAGELVDFYMKYSYSGSGRASRRQAALRLVSRQQSVIPRAHEIGESMELVVRRRTDGAEERYVIPWIKTGKPLLKGGPVPSPVTSLTLTRGAVSGEESSAPGYLKPWFDLQREIVEADENRDVFNVGSLAQVWAWPPSAQYQPRDAVFFRAGTFQAEGFRVGYIRIPNFGPSNSTAALNEFEQLIRYFNDNSDGLVVDVMRNNGGLACYNEEIQRRLIPYQFRGLGRELRASRTWLNQFSAAYESAKAARADEWIVATYAVLLDEMKQAYSENRARTGPIPICGPSLQRLPADVAYRKPLMVLTDEFSISAADGFPAVLQDARRGPIFGWRTNGAGGTIGSFSPGIFAEFTASATIAMHHRERPIVAQGYPTSNYVENVGVQPDIPYDFMTMENLLSGGRPFVEAFSAAMANHIRSQR